MDRKIGELGFKKLLSEELELALALKMIPALAFEKRRNRKTFELVVVEITNVADQQHLGSFVYEEIDKLRLYFHSIYI